MELSCFLRGIVVCIGGLILIGCEAASPIVGVLRPASGSAAAYGRAVGNGIDIAITQAEHETRLPAGFSIVEVDTGSDPEIAVAAYRRLVDNEGVRFIVGGMTSDEASALIDVADETRTICLSPSASLTDLAARSRFLFRLFHTDEAEGRKAARHLYDKMAVRSVVVFTDRSTWTRGIETEFRQNFELNLQGKIVKTIDLNSEKWRLRSSDALVVYEPDAVYVVGHAEKILEVMSHLKRAGYGGVRMTTSTFYLADVLSIAGDAAEGVLFPLPPYDADALTEPVNEFATHYREEFGMAPDIYAAHGFDAMSVAIHALRSTDVLYTSEIRKAMSYGMGEYIGVTGPISFDGHGDVNRYPVMHSVYQGRVLTWKKIHDLKLEEMKKMLEKLANQNPDFSKPLPLKHAGKEV